MGILWAIVVILFVLWVLGLVVKIAFAGIHLLLVLAVIVAIIALLGGRRRAL